MREATRSKVLWSAVIVIAVLAAGVLLGGCPKPQSTPTPPVPTPPPPPASTSSYGAKTPSTPVEPGKIQTAADPKHMTDLEKKHVPQFALPAEIKKNQPLSVTVNVGQVPHPMKADHYIEWIELYLDGKLIKKIDLKPGDKPMAKFEIRPVAGPHTLNAHINCNLHGLWANTVDITAK